MSYPCYLIEEHRQRRPNSPLSVFVTLSSSDFQSVRSSVLMESFFSNRRPRHRYRRLNEIGLSRCRCNRHHLRHASYYESDCKDPRKSCRVYQEDMRSLLIICRTKWLVKKDFPLPDGPRMKLVSVGGDTSFNRLIANIKWIGLTCKAVNHFDTEKATGYCGSWSRQ